MTDFLDFDFTSTIRDFDFTRRAIARMNRVLDSSDFEGQDSEAIFRYLSEQMEIISFSDYLKRYIYQRAEIADVFSNIPDAVYVEILVDAFKQNHVPHATEPTKSRLLATMKTWIGQNTLRRGNLFLLGFALRMTERDVSEFLTKVLKESDFDFQSPEECVYWHCYHNQLSYTRAAELLEDYKTAKPLVNEKLWAGVRVSPTMYLADETMLRTYLQILKEKRLHEQAEQKAYEAFLQLLSETRRIVAETLTRDALDAGSGKTIAPEDVSTREIENMICNGIPRDSHGNLLKISASLLAKQFSQKRLSRQRINKVLSKAIPVDRFDLITLLFFIYAKEVEPDWPTERYLQYLDRINEILTSCGMMEIYPANPYEAFVLMCLLAEEPLAVYGEVWELSYAE